MEKVNYLDVIYVLEQFLIDEPVIIEKNGDDFGAIISMEDFKMLNEVKEALNAFDNPGAKTQIKIAAPEKIDLTYDEYLKLKEELIKNFEELFKPDPEKYN